MKLFYASGSPYARIARVVVRELALENRVEEVEVTLRDPNSLLLPHNPGGKVPTLQLDDGTRYPAQRTQIAADGRVGRVEHAVRAGPRLRLSRRGHGVEPRAALRPERARGDRPRKRAGGPGRRRSRSGGAYSGPINASQIVLGAALENFSRRHKIWDWRSGHPGLSRFLDDIAERPSFAATIQPEINL